jgi:PKD repeat protein
MQRVILGSASSCPPAGPCDLPGTRNLNLPDTSQPIIWIRTRVTILRNSDGSSPSASSTDVTNSMNQLNSDFLPARVQFVYDWGYFDNTTYRNLTSAEDFSMKCASAVKPDSTLNIWVTDIAEAGVLGYSYLPWSGNALQCTYGCVIEQTATGGFGGGRHVMTHEVGHALGLYHTFHGVDEVGQCSACYENPGDPDADNLGDFCADTRPTPTNFSCGDVAGSSSCNGNPWAPTDYLNYMGYASTTCQTHFSPQQMARMRCWTQSALSPWIMGVRMQADTTFGPAPLNVTFTGNASQTATSWAWKFGDGQTSTLQNPTHLYGPGYYSPEVTIQTSPPGSYTSKRPGLISAYADTILADSVGVSAGKSVRVDVIARNFLPLTAINIPFTWAGTVNVVLDSVSNGSRTTGWPRQTVQLDNTNKRRTYGFEFGTGGPQAVLSAGLGPVLSLWFRVPLTTPPGTILPIGIISYGYQTPNMTCAAGNYPAVAESGAIIVCRAGDVNNDAVGPDIGDLTYLIAYLFISGPPPPIPSQANCDGIPGIDIGDLSALINYLFINGTPITCGA